jgi:uncharacterized protein YgiM (DUF1202 family)
MLRIIILSLSLSSTLLAEGFFDDLNKSSESVNVSQSGQSAKSPGTTFSDQSSQEAWIAGWLVNVDKKAGSVTLVVGAANLRSGIGTSHKVVRTAKKGEKFPFLGFDSNSRWVRVSLAPVFKRVSVPIPMEEQKGKKIKVRSGFTLSAIARKNYSSSAGPSRAFRFWPLIYVASELKSTNLRVGQELIVPNLAKAKREQMNQVLAVMVKSVHNLQAQLNERKQIAKNPLIKFLKGNYSKMVAALFPEFKAEFDSRLREVLQSNRQEFYRNQITTLEKLVEEAKTLEELADLATQVADSKNALSEDSSVGQLHQIEEGIRQQFHKISRQSMQELEQKIRDFKKLKPVDQQAKSSQQKVKQGIAYRLFERRYDLYALKEIPALRSQVSQQLEQLQDLEKELGPPDGELHPSIKRMNKGSNRYKSITVMNPRFKHWLEVASLIHQKDCQVLPQVSNRYGEQITISDIIKAIIIQESAGVHKKGSGKITAGLNKKSGKVISRDIGFGQINTRAHRDMKINVLRTSKRIADRRYPFNTLISVPFYHISSAKGSKNVLANFEIPMHNLHAMAKILASTFKRSMKYKNTGSETERLVKALSGYNHGMNSSDYNTPWQAFVSKVAEGRGNYGEEVGVHYGIRLQLLLGMDPSPAEIKFLKRERKSGSLSSFFLNEVEDLYAYANFTVGPG